MRTTILRRIALTAPLALAAVHAAAGEVTRFVSNAPESALDARYLYRWKILATTLEKTEEKYGAHAA